MTLITLYHLHTNINQSTQKLDQNVCDIRSCMSSSLDLIRPEPSELHVLELENLPYLTLFTL